MTDKHDKLVEMAQSAGFTAYNGVIYCHDINVTEKLAAFRSAILADAAKDVQVVAWQRKWDADGEIPVKEKNGNGRMAWPLRFKFLPVTRGKCAKDDLPLVPASTLAAAQALNAELVARVEGLERDAAKLRGIVGAAAQLLRDCIGPLEASAAILEDEDGNENIESLIGWLKEFDAGIDAAIAARSGT